MATQEVTLPAVKFALYGGGWKYISLSELKADENILAEVANSGSEGCYVEVAKYSFDRLRWERYAHHKFLPGDEGFECCKEAATAYAKHLNEGKVTVGFVHSFPDYEGE